MDRHVEHRAATGKFRLVEPFGGRPARLRAVVGEAHPDHVGRTDPAFVQCLPGDAHQIVESVRKADRKTLAAAPDRRADRFAFGHGHRDGLFQQHVATGFKRGDGRLGVKFVRRANRYDIEFFPFEHGPEIGILVAEAEFPAHQFQRRRIDIGDGGQLAVRIRRIPRDMAAAGDGPASDDSHAKFFHDSILSPSDDG
ncbi:hypothetical protein SDC9_169502 [bioreactor metagenome]|uniref:Uncharacterized protein n=1 Tax=bioreactor metagenome TaxID=1076179 RepID=A0A645G8K7_9ZZZZ